MSMKNKKCCGAKLAPVQQAKTWLVPDLYLFPTVTFSKIFSDLEKFRQSVINLFHLSDFHFHAKISMNKLESTQLNLCVICDRMGALNGQVEKLLYQNQEMRILLAKLLDVQAITAAPSSLSCLQQEVQKIIWRAWWWWLCMSRNPFKWKSNNFQVSSSSSTTSKV